MMKKIPRPIKLLLGVLFAGAVTTFFLWAGWIGHLASDDRAYISTAEVWLGSFPMVPDNHWAVRHPLNLAISASISIFGSGEFQSILPTLVYGVCLLLLLFFGASLAFGPLCATIFVTILTVTPIMSEAMSVASVDVVEAFFVFVCVSMFLFASQRDGSLFWLFLSGLCAGLAFLSRETAVALVIFLGLSFLFSPLFDRWRYFVIAGGFLTILGTEMIYYWLITGNPFLRIDIALGSIDFVDPETLGTGNISHDRWVGPILALLVNNEFGSLYWLAIGSGLWLLCRKPTLTALQSRVLITAIGLGVVWFLVVGYALDLRALPRYFLVPTVTATFVVGVCSWLWFRSGYLKVTGGLFALHLGFGLILVDLSNQNILLSERVAVQMVSQNGILQFYTDPRTAWRSERLARWHGISSGQIIGKPPPPNQLFLFSPDSVARGTAGPYGPFDSAEFKPSPDWQVIDTYRRPTTLGQLIMSIGLTPKFEELGLARMVWETQPTTLYRVSAGQQ